MPRKPRLGDYRRKRDFSRTPEPPPAGGTAAGRGKASSGMFVIQKHAATRLHYDFRLEMGGVLKSWAVPKAIPFAKGDKRLAMQVEDHPLEYARFEGTIPKGEYGGGTVMVWDIGRYAVAAEDALEALESGKLHLRLEGQKLRGQWTLVRTAMGEEKGRRSWLLMKTGETARPPAKARAEKSALSGRTMRQITEANDTQWHSVGPGFVAPMKPRLTTALPTGPGWLFEVKFDGYRAVAVKDGGDVALYSRNEKRFHFPEIAAAVAAMPCRSGVFDGEIIALDPEGRPSFQALQARELGELAGGTTPPQIIYYLFDMMHLDGADWRGRPLTERKQQLASLIPTAAGSPLRFSANLQGTPSNIMAEIKAHGFEGVVAKRADAPYEAGQRTGAWVKVKCVNAQEFVIGGYTAPKGTRSRFGAILVGYHTQGGLRYAGKTGAGFGEAMLEALFRRFQKLRTPECPFAGALPPDIRKQSTWVRPEIVCQIRFSEWTRDGRLRQPVFIGIREDRAAADVIRESAKEPPP